MMIMMRKPDQWQTIAALQSNIYFLKSSIDLICSFSSQSCYMYLISAKFKFNINFSNATLTPYVTSSAKFVIVLCFLRPWLRFAVFIFVFTFYLQVDLAILRLRQIAEDSSTYSNGFNQFLSEAKFPTIGTAANIEEVHSKIVQPYIQTLCRNVEKRFGDAAGKIGIAATIFKPSNVNTQDIDQQQEHVRALAKYFCLHEEEAVTEWVCFRNYLMKHQNDTTDQILKSMLTSDVGDSYPQIYQLAGIVLSCPIGTAGLKLHYSTALKNHKFFTPLLFFYKVNVLNSSPLMTLDRPHSP